MPNSAPFRRPSRAAAALAAWLASGALALADPAASEGHTLDLNAPPAAAPLSEQGQAAFREALQFDPLREAAASAARARSQKQSPYDLDWSRTDRPDGSAAVTVKRPLPLVWDTNFGADFGLGATPPTSYQPDKPLPNSREQNTGAAWANVKVPGIAAVDARVDRASDQSKVGTTVSRSVPVGTNTSVTLQGTVAVTETLGGTPASSAVPAPPVTSAPVWSTDRMVKFNIHSTGTTLSAGATSSTVDPISRSKISAEQKLYEGLSVTTTVTDVGAPASAKSVSAGFKWKW